MTSPNKAFRSRISDAAEINIVCLEEITGRWKKQAGDIMATKFFLEFGADRFRRLPQYGIDIIFAESCNGILFFCLIPICFEGDDLISLRLCGIENAVNHFQGVG